MSKESALARISEQIEQAVTPNFVTPTTMGEVLREIVNIIPKYTIYKASFNSNSFLESGDCIAGLWGDNKYIVAKFLGGDESNLDNFDVGQDISFSQ